MGRVAIAEKIAREIRKGSFSEPLAVYLLVEVRKLLEVGGLKDEYDTLTLYCDWVVHSKLSGTRAREIVEVADDFVRDRQNSMTEEEINTSRFAKFASLGKLKRQLLDCLGRHGVHEFGDAQWIPFLAKLILVIEDCPLTCKTSPQDMEFVDEVTLNAADKGLNNPEGIAVAINWEFRRGGIWRLGATSVSRREGGEAIACIVEAAVAKADCW